jgi:hypothetical protein
MKNISLYPSKELAYFTALIIGDGWLSHNKNTNNYRICMESTQPSQIEHFRESVNKCFPKLSVNTTKRIKIRKFKNSAKEYKGETTTIYTYSVLLFKFIKQYKFEKFKWTVPSWVYNSKSLSYAFIDGIIEAEGSFNKSPKYRLGVSRVSVISKYKENLQRLQHLLNKLKITSYINKHHSCFKLSIHRKSEIIEILNNCPKSYDKYIKTKK